jgi:quinol monooxygenase YgiN
MRLRDAGPDTGVLLASLAFRVQPHKRDEVLCAVDDTAARMRRCPGCTRVRVLADTDDPNAFTLLSEWHSSACADAFFASPGFQLFRGVRMLLRGDPLLVFDDIRSRVTRMIGTA